METQMTTASKACTKCGEVKPLEEFHNNKKARDGKRPQCKVCECANAKRWYVANREKKCESERRWRAANPEKSRAKCRRYYAANTDWFHARDRERLAKQSKRVARIRKLMAHFEGRTGWLEILAATIAHRSDAQGICWVASDIEELLVIHYYKEELDE